MSPAPQPPRKRPLLRFLAVVRTVVLFLIPIAALVLVGELYLRMQMHRSKTDSDYARDKGQPLPVRVFQVDVAPLSSDVPAECTALPNPTVELRGSISNRPVARTLRNVGDSVRKHQPLLNLVDQPERSAIESAHMLVNAYQDYVKATASLVQYLQTVRDQQLGLEKELRQAQVDMAMAKTLLARAETELRTSETALATTRVIAPMEAIVLKISQPGEVAQSETPLVTLAVIDPILLECWIPEEKLALVELGLPVEATFYARPGQSHEGKVTYLDAYEKEKDRLVLVRAELENPEHTILPGLHGIAEIKNQRSSVRIPSIALINPRADFAQVFTVDEGNHAWLRKITVGVSSSGYTEVLSGLVAGERVVIAGQIGLQEGDDVWIGGTQSASESLVSDPGGARE